MCSFYPQPCARLARNSYVSFRAHLDPLLIRTPASHPLQRDDVKRGERRHAVPLVTLRSRKVILDRCDPPQDEMGRLRRCGCTVVERHEVTFSSLVEGDADARACPRLLRCGAAEQRGWNEEREATDAESARR